MLLSEDERAPLKAIDFGLAVPYEPEVLPLTNLGIEGTPWWVRDCSPCMAHQCISRAEYRGAHMPCA